MLEDISIDIRTKNAISNQIQAIKTSFEAAKDRDDVLVELIVYCNPKSNEIHQRQYNLVNYTKSLIQEQTRIEGFKVTFSIQHPANFNDVMLNSLHIKFRQNELLTFFLPKIKSLKEFDSNCDFVLPVDGKELGKLNLRTPIRKDFTSAENYKSLLVGYDPCNSICISGKFNADNKLDYFLSLVGTNENYYSYYFLLSEGDYFRAVRAEKTPERNYWLNYKFDIMKRGTDLTDLNVWSSSNKPNEFLGYSSTPFDAVDIHEKETSVSFIYFWDSYSKDVKYFYTGAQY